jgi:hypothetical protein
MFLAGSKHVNNMSTTSSRQPKLPLCAVLLLPVTCRVVMTLGCRRTSRCFSCRQNGCWQCSDWLLLLLLLVTVMAAAGQ